MDTTGSNPSCRNTAVLFLYPFAALCLLLFTSCPALPLWGDHLDRIELPDGFSINVHTDEVPGARSLAFGPEGILFVGSRGEGRVYAVVGEPGGGKPGVVIVAEGLDSPNGVAVRDGDLYVAEISRILRFDDIGKTYRDGPEPVVVYDGLPQDEHHGWKYIAFGPDGMLYVPVGAPCNVCDPEDPRYASILRMKPDGTAREVYASGIRNTVGFDWQPETGVLWFTDNGRDWMGDNRPPDELNRAPEPGLHFGFPYCHGLDVPDPEYGEGRKCSDFTPPELELGPHVAALGMVFYTGSMFPEEYRDRVFIAEHGSWNRTVPIGYRVMSARVVDGRASDLEVFAEGWLQGSSAWGRPVDVVVAPDGSLLVSDDRGGAIYRIAYEAAEQQRAGN
ncbi:MAG: PQQ-dependent sugar dehydrogenase [Desulfatibacillaceae bacterium]